MSDYVYRVTIALSMLFNVILGGPLGQTLSARQYDLYRRGKPNMSKAVDMVLGKGHCLECWVWWRLRKW
jgi:hypothetical protein